MGLTVVDAGVVVALLDRSDRHHAGAQRALEEARDRGDSVALPVSAFAECLVHPARQGDDAIDRVIGFVSEFPIEVIPADIPVAVAAARLRARFGRLRLPDALVLATAEVIGADLMLTTGRGWPDRETLGLPAELVAL